ncbi:MULTISPECIES: hypothetical protein [Hyphomonas]|uniref:hypothetical protein n=1 Tax=Hyphomonas TaxID=85 RepID=UPI00135F1562|nr:MULTISPECIES: hypothetical protein [Hyphomonas]
MNDQRASARALRQTMAEQRSHRRVKVHLAEPSAQIDPDDINPGHLKRICARARRLAYTTCRAEKARDIYQLSWRPISAVAGALQHKIPHSPEKAVAQSRRIQIQLLAPFFVTDGLVIAFWTNATKDQSSELCPEGQSGGTSSPQGKWVKKSCNPT